jgi:hypothetical protein
MPIRTKIGIMIGNIRQDLGKETGHERSKGIGWHPQGRVHSDR